MITLTLDQLRLVRDLFEALLTRRSVVLNTGTHEREIRASSLVVEDIDALDNELPRWVEFFNTLVDAGHLTVVLMDESYIVPHRELDSDCLMRMYGAFLEDEADREAQVLRMQDVMPLHGTEYLVPKGDKTFRRFDENLMLAQLLYGQYNQNNTPEVQAVRLF